MSLEVMYDYFGRIKDNSLPSASTSHSVFACAYIDHGERAMTDFLKGTSEAVVIMHSEGESSN